MRNCARLLLFGASLAFAAGASESAALRTLPTTLGYRFMVGGKPVGRTDIRVTQTPSALRFESTLRVATSEKSTIELHCRTEADPRTFEVRSFSYAGTKGGMRVSSDMHADGDSVYGTILTGEKTVAKSRVALNAPIVVFEDWVMELEILLALRQEVASAARSNYSIVFANSFLTADAVAGYTGEVLEESRGQSVVARKLQVEIQGAAPFASHFDPNRGVPLYIQFPGVRAEAFLDGFFGENPLTRFPATPDPASAIAPKNGSNRR